VGGSVRVFGGGGGGFRHFWQEMGTVAEYTAKIGQIPCADAK
jgi:hypothetical protein